MTNTETVPPAPLDPLARRITGALQVNGRASWRRIAQVLDEPVRTVSRRGAALLDEGSVRVVGARTTEQTHVLRVRSRPGRVAATGLALAGWPAAVFVRTTTERGEVVAEVTAEPDEIPTLLDGPLARLPGLLAYRLNPVLHYFRTTAEWRSGELSPTQAAALELGGVPSEQNRPDLEIDEIDEAIIDAIVTDGRTPFDTIAALGGFSEATARRRIDQLLRRGTVHIRAVAEPALLGRPVEALLWIRCRPRHVEAVGTELAASPLVRYAAQTTGKHALVVELAAGSLGELRDFLRAGQWPDLVDAVHPSMVAQSFKRSGVLTVPAELPAPAELPVTAAAAAPAEGVR